MQYVVVQHVYCIAIPHGESKTGVNIMKVRAGAGRVLLTPVQLSVRVGAEEGLANTCTVDSQGRC